MIKNELKVSQLFVDIFQYFNVYDQRDRMKNLSKIELYLLLDTCVDAHDEDDATVALNFSSYSLELKEILKIQSGDPSSWNVALKDLIKLTNDPVLKSEKITESGEYLPEVFTKEQVRELKLNKIFDK
jgi:hypothetical protein